MTKDEALALALEAHQAMREWIEAVPDDTVLPAMPGCDRDWLDTVEANLKKALALDKKAENARELGLDYEPADGTQVSKVWWDGEKLMAKPIPLEDIYQPVQEPVAFVHNETGLLRQANRAKGGDFEPRHWTPLYTTPPAHPPVPDALTSADIQEHIEYVAGWNDCRAEMLKGMKP